MVFRVQAVSIPTGALLEHYCPRRSGEPGYADCYALTLDRPVSLSLFIAAFYSTPVFRVERFVLARLLSRPSTDEQLQLLADGTIEDFAAWRVEARQDDQILLCDFRATTRSWLKVEAMAEGCRLYFGSAVVATRDAAGQIRPPALGFRLLLGFHRLYSKILLAAAGRRLLAG